MKKLPFKILKKYVLRLAVLGFVLINIIACNHAYRFTHFSEDLSGIRVKPENLSFSAKIKVLLTGIENPKPFNSTKPSRSYKNIRLSNDKVLDAWLIEIPEAKGIVLIFHGYSGCKSKMLDVSEEFNQQGYSTFLVDFRASGDSEGLQTTIGYNESKDVTTAFEYIKKEYPDMKTILFGTSMGAVAIMKAISEEQLQPEKLILQCPFGSMRATTKKRFDAMGIPAFPMADILLCYGGIQNGFNPFTHKPTTYANQIDIPTLLLYGIHDKRVSRAATDEIFQNINAKKELVLLPNSGHDNYLKTDARKWRSAVTNFLK